MSVSTNLSDVDVAVPPSGNAAATYQGRIPHVTQPGLASEGVRTLIVWPSRDGVIEGWVASD